MVHQYELIWRLHTKLYKGALKLSYCLLFFQGSLIDQIQSIRATCEVNCVRYLHSFPIPCKIKRILINIGGRFKMADSSSSFFNSKLRHEVTAVVKTIVNMLVNLTL